MGVFVAFGMSCIMSFAMVAINMGFRDNFAAAWFKAWALGFAVGFPAAAILVPGARRLVQYLSGIKL